MSSVFRSGRGIAATIRDIDVASDEPRLRAGLDRAFDAVGAELRAHTPASTLAAAWSEVLRHAVGAAARIESGADVPQWTWFVSGSGARGEAAPGSDVETMVMLADTVEGATKTALLARAAEVHALLERCGVLGDANGVLASRPRFCRRRLSWAEGIEQWTANPRDDRGVVMTGLMADSTAVWGTLGVADDELRGQNLKAVGRNYPVRQAMLQDATATRAAFPSRLRMFTTHADTVDLKLVAIDPVVKIARWAGLVADSDALSTTQRLEAAAAAKALDADDVSSLLECHQWLVRFRWRIRAGAFLDGRRVSDLVSLSELAPQERAMLRSVAREVAGISRKLTYLASTSAFH
ncbi:MULTISPECIES: putative nucleotidyltransferase substrate binding domain-containing protein [unclassified Mycobacterium]|uniref:putative nucleotidyltransferase substrate binding domain-containing protein n=1 Tax=unclassified Mycobacterium TaxID=2642494 RepID=UPI0029C7AD8C|nr:MULTISPECIES: putative nucleotidyltransferase substrate binding domain-containing protein [unclassified Mycobacterium]